MFRNLLRIAFTHWLTHKFYEATNVFAWPVAWYAMNRWLESFDYRIATPMILVGSGLIALCIAWVTAAQAASAKPVLALRHE